MNTLELSAVGIAREVAQGNISAVDVAQAHLDRIKSEDPKIRAFIKVLESEALAQARAVDEKRARGETLGRLAGVPVGVKDNIMIKGVGMTAGSRILEGYRAPYDGTVISRLRREDAVFIGKTNLDEFGMGSSTENSAFFKTANPWDLGRVPGGSSGGSAAAVAAGLCAIALGSDTGGSIRQPAAFCGVVGLKPTYGAVSRYGLAAFASSLDQIGPLARSVPDAELALSVIAGHDPKDSTSAREPLGAGKTQLKGLRVGLPKEYFSLGLDPEVEKSVREAVSVLEGLGAVTSEVSLPYTRHALAAYYIIAPCEASSNLARYDGIRYGLSVADGEGLEAVYEDSRGKGFGAEVKRRIMLGTYALSAGYYDAYYGKAQRVRTLIMRDFENVFKSVDILAMPVTPTPPFRFGERSEDPLAMYLSDTFTVPSSMAGNPGVSIPCGRTAAGLPVGLQLVGDRFHESTILAAAARYESARPFPRPA